MTIINMWPAETGIQPRSFPTDLTEHAILLSEWINYRYTSVIRSDAVN